MIAQDFSASTLLLHLAFSHMQPLATVGVEYGDTILALEADDIYLPYLRARSGTTECTTPAELRALLANPDVDLVLIAPDSVLQVQDIERACALAGQKKSIVYITHEALPC